MTRANFNKIIKNFNVEINSNKNFNDEIYTRYNMIFILCTIYKVNYINHENFNRLNNYMFNIHVIKIRSTQIINQKRYIN